MNDENEDRSFLFIEFTDIGSAEIKNYDANNITALQLLTMAQFLEFEGKNALAVQRQAQIQAQMQKEQMQKIAVPKGNIEIGKK